MISPELASILMSVLFAIGYFFITVEHYTKINKTSVALLMAVACWIVQLMHSPIYAENNLAHLNSHIADISQIIFFILGALAIVELISAHKGFQLISNLITVGSKKRFLWVICLLTFFLSSVLDNLTTTIVMISLLRKMLPRGEDRLIIGSGVVIAANAGGAWTPIGDVTTTMLWIGGQVSSLKTMTDLFIPSFACLLASTSFLSYFLKGKFIKENSNQTEIIEPRGKLIFLLGVGSLVFVPIFKLMTGLPPFMGVLFGLSFLWLITDILHSGIEDRAYLRIPHVLSKIDLSGVLFFLGILLAVSALETAGLLHKLAIYLSNVLPNLEAVAVIIGLASAIVDNVPLVAASMSMYDLTVVAQDSDFWQFIALAAGTGGSILIIGSAAGVVFMGLEKVDFFWYLKKISLSALVGFFTGIGVLFAQKAILAAF